MKKYTVPLSILALLLALAACGSNETAGTPRQAPTANQTSGNTADNTPGGDEEEAKQVSAPPQPGKDAEENHSEEDGKAPEQTAGSITFEGLTAVDNAECRIEITDIDIDNIWGYTLEVQMENKSTEKTYMYTVDSAAINGVQTDPFFASEIAAGKKGKEEINFSTDSLAENGITEFTDIELTFRVYDSDDWTADPAAKETVHVYPYGEEKAVLFSRETQPSDTVIVDNEDVTVTVTGYEMDEIWGYTVNLFLINRTDKDVVFTVDEASVNGYMADPFFAADVSAGKCAFNSVSWSESTLEDIGITEVEEIEFKLRAYDSNDWTAKDFANEKITLNP